MLTGVPAHMLVDNHSVSSTLVCRRDAVCAYLNVVAFAGAGDSEVPQGCASTVVQVDWTLLEWRIVQSQPSTGFHLYRRFSFGCAQQYPVALVSLELYSAVWRLRCRRRRNVLTGTSSMLRSFAELQVLIRTVVM